MNDQQKTKKQLLEDLQRERERSIALQEVSNKVVAAHDTDEVLDLIVNEAVRLIAASAATLRLLEGNRLVPRAATDSATAHLAVAAEIKETYIAEDSSSIMGRVLATKKPYLTEDAQNDPLLTSEAARQNLQRSGFHSWSTIKRSEFWSYLTREYASGRKTKSPSCPPLPTKRRWPWRKPGS